MEQQNKDDSQPAEGQRSVQERRQMEKKPQDIKTLPHRGVRQAERIQLPALPPLPRQAATQTAAPKQVPAAEASSSERATCKLPPLQAAASASSGGGRAKSLGTEARSQQELLPPLPCISGNRDRAVRAERRERGPHSPVAPDEDVGNAIRSFVSTVITNTLACNEGASSKTRLSPSGRGPRTKGPRTPPLTTAAAQNWKSRHSSKSSLESPAEEMDDRIKAFVSTAIRNGLAWNQGAMREARLPPVGRPPTSKGHRTPPQPATGPQNLKKSWHPAPHSPADSCTALQDTAHSRVSEVLQKTQKSWEHGQRSAALGDLAQTGCKLRATSSAGVQTDLERTWTTSLPGPDSRVCSGARASSRDPAAASPGQGKKKKQQGEKHAKPRQGTGNEGTSQGRGKKESSPGGCDEEEIVIINSWINPRFASLFTDAQDVPQQEGSAASSVDREAAEEAKHPASASPGSLQTTDTAPSAAPLEEGPGEERHSTPLTYTTAAQSRPASPPAAPALEDEGHRAPPLTRGAPQSKPSASPSPSEHSTAVMVESQGRARHASSACDDELDERVDTIVSTVLRRVVAMSQGAVSKAPSAPSATGPSVPPPTAEPADSTSSASALAGALGDLAHTGSTGRATRSAGVQTDMERRRTTALPGPDSQVCAGARASTRDPAAASPGQGKKQNQRREKHAKPRQGTGNEGTSQGRGKKESSPGGCDEEEIVIINSWINPRFASLFTDAQDVPQQEGSAASSVDREAAEEAKHPASASPGSLQTTDTAPSAAPLEEGPGEERHSTPLTYTTAAQSRPASPPAAPALEDEGHRAPPLTRGAQQSKPSACASPSEHSAAVMVESQGRARHACSVSDEELDERVDTIVAAVLLHSVAIIQGAPSKAASAPWVTVPRVPPPTPEPAECTSSASALARGHVGEANEAPLAAAATPQEGGEGASPLAAEPLQEPSRDFRPAAADKAGAAASPLVPGHQVAIEQGGQAQSSSCTKDMPADEPATSQTQAPSQDLLAGPVQRSEQHQAQGILDLAQAPARQPRPSRIRRALRALRRAFRCRCIAGQRE
ncbi:uncharacterized protein [Anas platyrhynchos]|uniref:uncharacterized protein n=1 Tax=Anas platyrhynchos TaxID=8839 RepID=UPI000F7C2798|eukprot:XP_027303281.1 nascent polypeptide-associated complex subunit alpha, muscle-specific form-like [Anas platyrhynchos]